MADNLGNTGYGEITVTGRDMEMVIFKALTDADALCRADYETNYRRIEP